MAKMTIAAARVNAGLSQEQLAKEIGVSRQSVIAWETGKTEVRTPVLLAISMVTGIPVDDIIMPVKST